MSLYTTSKINKLLQSWPSGAVGVAKWMSQKGVSPQLQQRYLKSGWIESIGRGAVKRAGDTVDWVGGLYALQTQAGLSVHVGAQTALGLQGLAHYLELNAQIVHLFAPPKTMLPRWFREAEWGVLPKLHCTELLPTDVGLVDIESKLFTVKISSPARALMECLYLAPEEFDLLEAYQIMETLTALRSSVVQSLLQQCRSIKVKRLFLFMASKAHHQWMKRLDISLIDLGAGKRSLDLRDSAYSPEYKITVPRKLFELS